MVLADGNQAHFRPLDARELEGKLSGSGLESEIYRGVRRLAQENARRNRATLPQDHAARQRVQPGRVPHRLALQHGPHGGRFRGHPVRRNRGQDQTWCRGPTMTGLSVLHFADHLSGQRGGQGNTGPRPVVRRDHGQDGLGPLPAVAGPVERHGLHRRRPRRHPGRGVLRRVGR